MAAADPIVALQAESLRFRWSLAKRIAFRFCFVYFGLYCLGTQIFGGLLSIPNVDVPDLDTLWPLRPLIFFAAAHVFGAKLPLVYSGSGSGDKTFDWVMMFLFLVFAGLATVMWSILDRRRENYGALNRWFRLFLRFALASQMMTYALAKIFPMQMPFPNLRTLVEPFGDFSPMGVLWTQIGASPAYEIVCGSAELLAGILLVIPRTALLGALVCAGVTSEIFILNMTYDVPVKQLSFHLLLMALVLAAPEFSRLLDFFLRDRPVGPSTQAHLFRSARANRIALAAQIVFGLWLLGTNIYGGWDGWRQYGGARPESPLYGIWKIDKMVIDGHERSPLLNDYDRWRSLVSDSPQYMSFQRMDDSSVFFGTTINVKDQTIALTKEDDKKWKGNLRYARPDANHLTLDGSLGATSMQMQLVLKDRNQLNLVKRGFHWVSEYPYNR